QYNDVGLLIAQRIYVEQETANRTQHQAQRQYTYDANYLLTQVQDSQKGILSYQYDAIGRLIQAQSSKQTERYHFDPAGNLIDPVAMQSAEIKNNLVKHYQGKHYKYDAQGNVIETQQADQELKLKWDKLNRLI